MFKLKSYLGGKMKLFKCTFVSFSTFLIKYKEYPHKIKDNIIKINILY